MLPPAGAVLPLRPASPPSGLPPRTCTIPSLNDEASQRTIRPIPAPASTQMAMVTAARTATGPVIRSWAYGGREKPATVSQPINPSTGATSGSATTEMARTMAAARMSTPVAGSRPPSPAASAPVSSSAVKPAGSAKWAASPRGERLRSIGSSSPRPGQAGADLHTALTRPPATLTRP